MKHFLEFKFIHVNFQETFDWAIQIVNADDGHRHLINKCMQAVVPKEFFKHSFAHQDVFRTEQFTQHAIQAYNTQNAENDIMQLSLEIAGDDFEVHSYEPRDLGKLIPNYEFPIKEYIVNATIRLIVLEHFRRRTT